MARTFEQQVEVLTGLAITSSSVPTQDQLSQFLADGVEDIVNKVIALKPEDTVLFSTTSNDTGSGVTVESGVILNVTREHDTSGFEPSISTYMLRPAERIPAKDRMDAQDPTSLKFRSKYNPAYYVKDKMCFVIPKPTSTAGDRGIVNHVAHDTAVAYDDQGSNIANFPSKYYNLVALYGAMKTIQAKIASVVEDDEDSELVQLWNSVFSNLQGEYEAFFGKVVTKIPKQQQQPQGGASEG
jgi:hypothetical protein